MIRRLLQNQKDWHAPAVITDEDTITYRDLLQRASMVRAQVRNAGAEIVAICLPNSADYIAALHGVFLAGGIAFPLNVALSGHETAQLLRQVPVGAILTSRAYCGRFHSHVPEGVSPGEVSPGEVSPGEAFPPILCMEELPAYETGNTAPAKSEPIDMLAGMSADISAPMILLPTSGTLGNAKIVQLSEANAAASVQGFVAYNDYERFAGDIRYILGTPFCSVYGLLILSTCLLRAFPIVIPTEEAFTPDTLYRAVQRHRVTHYEGGTALPILMDQMSGHAHPYDISSLQFVGYGGSPIPEAVLRRLDAAFARTEFCTGYGMTESASLIARPYKRINPTKRMTVGRAIPDVTIGIETEDGITYAPHVTGEVVVKGPNVMLGYYKNEAETARILKDGYLHTGDIGYLDEEGDLFLCGRKKNVIKVRGFSVYAEEVEAFLLSSGLICDCVVYGEAADVAQGGGESLCADVVCISADACEADIRAYCREHLAAYKQPQRIRLVEALQKTATGKTKREAGQADGAD